MKKLAAALIMAILVSTVVVAVQGAFPFSLGVYIESPVNGATYQTNDLLLNITSEGIIGSNIQRSCTYTLDGKNGGSINLRTNSPTSFHAITIGETMLYDLENCEHSITVTLTTTANGQIDTETSTVTFFVADSHILALPLLAMPVEYVNYTIANVNGTLWAKIDGTYPIHKLSSAEETFELNNVTYIVTSDDLPMVYPTPPGTTNIHVELDATELEWSNYTETYPDALHYTAVGDWPMIYCMISKAPEYFTLRIHYEHPLAVINGSYTFLYDLNISPYLTPWSNKSIAFFNIHMETNCENLNVYTVRADGTWNPINYTTTKEELAETISVKITSEYDRPLSGDLAVTFTEAEQQGFLGTGLPTEYGYAIVAMIVFAAATTAGYLFLKRRK